MNYLLVYVGTSSNPNVYAKISPEDAGKALKYKWSWTRGKDRNGPLYARAVDTAAKPPRQIKLHRLVLDAPAGVDIDHINGDTLDNRRENLRFVTAQQNLANSRKRRVRSSRFKGVSWHGKAGKWRAYIAVGRKQTHLGLFDTEQAAALAYDVKATEVWGEYAHLNLG